MDDGIGPCVPYLVRSKEIARHFSLGPRLGITAFMQITFNGDNVTIKYNDGTSATFDMETVTIDFSKVTSIGERIEMTKKMGLEGKQVYDLKGRKAGKSAAALKKGIYVIDGKKVIIK